MKDRIVYPESRQELTDLLLTGNAHVLRYMSEIKFANADLVLDSFRGVDVCQGFIGAHELGLPVRWYDTDHVEHMWSKHPFRPVFYKERDLRRVVLGSMPIQ